MEKGLSHGMAFVRDLVAGQISKSAVILFFWHTFTLLLLYFTFSRPDILSEVELIDSDMPVMKRESIILLILEIVTEKRSPKVAF